MSAHRNVDRMSPIGGAVLETKPHVVPPPSNNVVMHSVPASIHIHILHSLAYSAPAPEINNWGG